MHNRNTEKTIKSDLEKDELIWREEAHNSNIGKEITVDSEKAELTNLRCCEELNYDATDEDSGKDDGKDEDIGKDDDKDKDIGKDAHDLLDMKRKVQKDGDGDSDFAYGVSTDEDTRYVV